MLCISIIWSADDFNTIRAACTPPNNTITNARTWHIYNAMTTPGDPGLVGDPDFITDPSELIKAWAAEQRDRGILVLDLPSSSHPLSDIRQRPLPEHRNIGKDTAEFIASQYIKYDCIEHSLNLLGESGDFEEIKTAETKEKETIVAWFNPRALTYCTPNDNLLSWLHMYMTHLPEEHKKSVFIPGGWNPLTTAEDCVYILNNAHWRFTGEFIIGRHAEMRDFLFLFRQCMESYFLNKSNPLIWEFNMLARAEWMYTHDPNDGKNDERNFEERKWPVKWFRAFDDASIFRLPALLTLCECDQAVCIDPCFPDLPNYHASSSSVVYTTWGKVTNVRYVNYWMDPSGKYHFPTEDRQIHTRNLAVVDYFDSSNLNRAMCWMEEDLGIDKHGLGSLSTGLEDVRLYYESDTGDIRFVATTLEYSVTPKIITGLYVIEPTALVITRNGATPSSDIRGWFKEGRVLASPEGDKKKLRWEKNWIPLYNPSPPPLDNQSPLNNPKTQYIYSWGPLRIGGVDAANSALCIHTEHDHSLPILQKACGSSPFVPALLTHAANDCLLGVVHYSNDSVSPRHYYHMLVKLCPQTYRPIGVSVPFTFAGKAIEYCLSVHVMTVRDEFETECNRDEPKKYVFWISQFDRDPCQIHIPVVCIPFADLN